MKKVSVILTLFLINLLVACSTNQTSEIRDENADKGLDIIGQGVQFDPNKLVNNGDPITIEYWTWNDADPAIAMAEAYEEIYPNVNINIVNNPWEDYWTKLPLTLQGSDGPAIFNIHNSQHDILIPYLAPYEISLPDLQADFISLDTHIIDGNVYYIDSLINSGAIYYNLDLWEEAGLTETDIPQTWEQFREVASMLTQIENDTIIQAGFNFNGDYDAIFQGLNYQKGTLLFKDEGKTVNYNNETTIENMEFLMDLYEIDEVGSKDFGTDSSQSFGNGQSAIVYKWGWFLNELDTNYPDIHYGVFPTPTPSEAVPFAYDRYNGESTPGINNNQSNDQQAVAQDFLRFCLANDEYFKQGALTLASFPNKRSLTDDEAILANPVLATLAPRIDRLIWPGAVPATIETTVTQVIEDILYNGKEIRTTIADGQAKMEADMRNSNFTSLEKNYPFFDEAN